MGAHEVMNWESSSDGRMKIILLAQLFHADVEDEFKEQAIIMLCRAAGEWGAGARNC